jgi:hypothetical protein
MTSLSGATWRKSSRSDSNQNCVEVATSSEVVGVRDSKDPWGPAFVFGPAAFGSFLAGVKRGEFDGEPEQRLPR